jgi:hypothetical protein
LPSPNPKHARTLGEKCAGGEGTLQGKLSHAGPCFQLTSTAALSLLLHCPPASPSRLQHWLRGEGKGSQWRWRSREEKVIVGESKGKPIPTFVLDDAANNPLYGVLIHVIVLS